MAVSVPKNRSESEGEDWHNVSDPRTRRKLQNRQNQRARRLRNTNRGAEPLIKQYVPGNKTGRFVYLARSDNGRERNDECRPVSHQTQLEDIRSSLPLNDCQKGKLQQRLTREDDQCSRNAVNPIGSSSVIFAGMGGVDWQICRTSEYWQRGYYLHSDRLLTLLYYNVFRGFTWNMEILGLDLSQMSQEDYPSPFLSTHVSDDSTVTKLPTCLRPTEVQRRVYHHAGYDVFPCAIIRDNMIQHSTMSEEDEHELCLDMEGLNKSSHGIGTDPGPYSNLDEGDRSGITLWGDPWDLGSWEISEYVALKYPWLVVGAIELEVHTNARRRVRGWREIHFA